MSKSKLNKQIVKAAIPDSMGIVSLIARRCGVSRVNLWKWLKKNQDIQALIDAETEVFIDFAESKLVENVRAGDTTSIIYALKSKGKHRGWGERLELAGAKDQPLEIEVNVIDDESTPAKTEDKTS
jgi:hypothetical protein